MAAIPGIIFLIANSSITINVNGNGSNIGVPAPVTPPVISTTPVPSTSPLRIVSRAEWSAQPPANELPPAILPARRVVIGHTATENCTTQAECVFRIRQIQTYHMESRGWDDIGWNFLIGGDGAVYVGRGWEHQGAHTKGFNVNSTGIAFVGTFTPCAAPPALSLRAAQKLIEMGTEMEKLSEDYQLYGQRQLMPTESPGEALYQIIKTWDHWSDTLITDF